MTRLIDADPFEKESDFDEHGNYMKVENLILDEMYRKGYNDGFKFRNRIETQERKHGEWVDIHNGTYTCSACGLHHSKSNFCPNCGADMRKEGEAE